MRIAGRQNDGQGRLRDWWNPVTAGMFNETTPCMKEQYDRYKIGNMTVSYNYLSIVYFWFIRMNYGVSVKEYTLKTVPWTNQYGDMLVKCFA